MKLCTVCGVVTSRAGSRCTDHARQSNRSRHNALYSTRAWQRLSARVLRAWRGERGNWCPGYQRAAHPAADLTVDHVVPLAAGGAPFDIGKCAVLCVTSEFRVEVRKTGRGERISADTFQLSVRIQPGSATNVPACVHRASEIAWVAAVATGSASLPQDT